MRVSEDHLDGVKAELGLVPRVKGVLVVGEGDERRQGGLHGFEGLHGD